MQHQIICLTFGNCAAITSNDSIKSLNPCFPSNDSVQYIVSSIVTCHEIEYKRRLFFFYWQYKTEIILRVQDKVSRDVKVTVSCRSTGAHRRFFRYILISLILTVMIDSESLYRWVVHRWKVQRHPFIPKYKQIINQTNAFFL